jgi:hypothetical protein
MTSEQAAALLEVLLRDPCEPPEIDWTAGRRRVYLILLGSLRD